MNQKKGHGGKAVERKAEAGPGVVIFYGTDMLKVTVPSGLQAFHTWVNAGPREPGDPDVIFTCTEASVFIGFHIEIETLAPVTTHALRDTPGWSRAVLAWVRLKARADADGITLPSPTLWILPR
jgi:hypothetical protein